MKKKILALILMMAALGVWPGCNEELGPLNEPSGFSGVIRFKNWPPATSIKEMRLVAFDQVPTDSAAIIPTLIAGGAAAYPSVTQDYLPTLVDSVVYAFTTTNGTNLQVKDYAYVAVMYQFGPNILTDWRPAGVYTAGAGGGTPVPVRVILHHISPNIDIQVDFNNLPRAPWH